MNAKRTKVLGLVGSSLMLFQAGSCLVTDLLEQVLGTIGA